MIDKLGDRMKEYEAVFDAKLPKRTPVILRIDGRGFSKLTKTMKLDKPIDFKFRNVMAEVAIKLCKEMMNVKVAFLQSDEISFLMVDYPDIEKECWFGNRVQKICSVSASLASSKFTQLTGMECSFDARVFIIPPNDVCNYFIWRQQDATRNSVNMLAQSLFPCKQLQGLNINETMDKMFKEKGVNWNNSCTQFKRGSCISKKLVQPSATVSENFVTNEITRWTEDKEIPIFTEDRQFINKFVPEFQSIELL